MIVKSLKFEYREHSACTFDGNNHFAMGGQNPQNVPSSLTKVITKNAYVRSHNLSSSYLKILPFVKAFIPADVTGGGLDKIVSIPCGLGALWPPGFVC